MTLLVRSRFGFDRLYRLADDGLFSLDVATLPWGSRVQEADFELTRWERTEVVRFGHAVELVAKSSARFSGQYLEVGPRDALQATDTCTQAAVGPSLVPGTWWYGTDPLGDDVEVCADDGADGIFRIDVPSRTLLTVEHQVVDAPSVLGLSTTCPATGPTCLTRVAEPTLSAFANHVNVSDETESVFILADTVDGAGDPVFATLDVDLEPLMAPELFDECVAVRAGASLLPGIYYSAFTAYTPQLNPGAGGCTGRSAPGPDAIAPITVGSGQTLSVLVDMPGADPSLYLLGNCNDAFSCLTGADTGADADENLVYTNTSGGAQNLFLVVDSADGLAPFVLSVNLN